MNMNSEIDKNYVSLDDIFVEFSENVDYIPLFISQHEIDIKEIDSQEYIQVSDYKKIKNSIYLKRNSKEILITKNDNLIEYNSSKSDSEYFLNLVYELNESIDELINENNSLKEENYTLKNIK